MNSVSFWRTLFLVLLAVNLTLLSTNFTDYSGKFVPLNHALAEEFQSALETDASTYNVFTNPYPDAVNQLQILKPPFWKKTRHFEYTALAAELRGMEPQIRQQASVSTDTWKASYSHMPNTKPADVDRLVKSMEDNMIRQQKARERLVPKFKDKLDRFKFLGDSLS